MQQERPRIRKSPALLDSEIAEALARRRSGNSRRHHATIATMQEAPASDAWDVAMDALLEHNPARAAEIVSHLKKAHGPVSMTAAFSKALGTVPKAVRNAFEKASGVVSKHSYDWPSFTKGATHAFWADTYRDEVTNLPDEARRALSPRPGGTWESVLPDPPAAARAVGKKFAKATLAQLTDEQLSEVASKFSAEGAGYYGAMQSLGHGVGWFEEDVDVDPPEGFDYDTKLTNAVWTAIRRKAREADIKL